MGGKDARVESNGSLFGGAEQLPAAVYKSLPVASVCFSVTTFKSTFSSLVCPLNKKSEQTALNLQLTQCHCVLAAFD